MNGAMHNSLLCSSPSPYPLPAHPIEPSSCTFHSDRASKGLQDQTSHHAEAFKHDMTESHPQALVIEHLRRPGRTKKARESESVPTHLSGAFMVPFGERCRLGKQ